jgi:hypothetical protein
VGTVDAYHAPDNDLEEVHYSYDYKPIIHSHIRQHTLEGAINTAGR